jgi:predicted Rossmann-fold nucleotide-binding protein
MDEFFESMTLIQTEKVEPFPVILIGKSFWAKLVGWMDNVMLRRHKNISPEDMQMFHMTDSLHAVVRIVEEARARDRRRAAEALRAGHRRPSGEGTVVGVVPRLRRRRPRRRR